MNRHVCECCRQVCQPTDELVDGLCPACHDIVATTKYDTGGAIDGD